MPQNILDRLTISPTTGLAIGLMAVLLMMVLPIPPIVLDLGLTASFAFAILILTITLFVERPLDFSSFPAILLVSLLLRLALNISSTKLIIGEGHTGTNAAGGVIEGFAMFIMGGNLAIGLIVFAVLVIVNFLVITKGAGRMAEVGARFALDAMPGKQLAIDADVSSGAITHDEAKRLRAREQQETAFLGSLDGVSKFVKGDAIAGLLITLLNLVAGVIVGMVVHRISFADAIQNYSILTVGDGLVSQIPAVVISVAAALLLSKGRGEESVDLALLRELGGRPEALLTVACVMAALAIFPGLPFLPFLFSALLLAFVAWRQSQKAPPDDIADDVPAIEAPKTNFGDVLEVEEIHIELSPDLIGTVIKGEAGFDGRVEKIRKFIVQEFGFLLPPVRVTDRPSLKSETYQINIQGVPAAKGQLRPGKWLALVADDQHQEIDGENTVEPVYGAHARWVDFAGKERMLVVGVTVVEPSEVMATHLMEVIQTQFPKLMTRRSLRSIIDTFTSPSDPDRARDNQRLVDDLIPDRISYELLLQIMRDLLSERISIRHVPLILEAIAEIQSHDRPIEDIVEHVRKRIAFQFVSKLADDAGRLPAIQLDDHWAEKLGNDIDAEQDLFEGLATSVRTALDRAAQAGVYPIIAVSAPLRRKVKRVMATYGIRNPVLSIEEIGINAKLDLVGAA